MTLHNLKNTHTHTHTQSTNNNNFGCKTQAAAQMEQEIPPQEKSKYKLFQLSFYPKKSRMIVSFIKIINPINYIISYRIPINYIIRYRKLTCGACGPTQCSNFEEAAKKM